ncbi:MAG TPA: hypothetical protein VEY92_00715 [Pseudoxanthomonas sp.]|nr:hypothetical protein [Pseudoxanthomonas sp.]
MNTYKNYWTERYRTNAHDWPGIIKLPLFDPEGRWTYGGPAKITDEIGHAMVLTMGEAPRDLVQAKIKRAKQVVEAVDRLDLLNTDKRHIGSEHSRIDYLRGKLMIGLMEGCTPLADQWSEIALLKLKLFEVLKGEGTSAPYEKLHAMLYLLLAREYAEAKLLVERTRSAKGYELEFSALKALTAELAAHGAPLQNPEVRAQVLDYFDQMRNPQPDRVPGKPYTEFNKSTLDKFEWALLIGEVIEPGDGRLDAWRALELVSR